LFILSEQYVEGITSASEIFFIIKQYGEEMVLHLLLKQAEMGCEVGIEC